MPYALLVIGALMSVAGIYAIVTGYHIVQVEEGWTSVIAGSVLFVGGFLMIALGLVLRTLLDLKSSLRSAPAVAVAPAADAPVESFTAPAVPALAVAPPPPAPIESKADVPPPPPELAPAAPTFIPPPFRFPEPEARVEPAPAATLELPPPPPLPVESIPEPIEPRPVDDYKLETPSTPEHDLVKPETAPEPPPSAPSDDWLDRAFAEFDQEVPKTESKPTPPKMPPAPRMPELKIQHEPPEPPREPAFAEAEPAHAAAAPAAPEPPAAPTSAVIGRYEADGTTYVMFADGSIEAQSEAGVYRFASMAELKSFIET